MVDSRLIDNSLPLKTYTGMTNSSEPAPKGLPVIGTEGAWIEALSAAWLGLNEATCMATRPTTDINDFFVFILTL